MKSESEGDFVDSCALETMPLTQWEEDMLEFFWQLYLARKTRIGDVLRDRCEYCGLKQMRFVSSHTPDCKGYRVRDTSFPEDCYADQYNIDGWYGPADCNSEKQPAKFDDLMPWQLIDWSVPT